MPITFTTTQAGASADYMKYLGDKPVKTDRYKDSDLFDFSLIPFGAEFVKLERGAYITVESETYGKWFTGYIVNDPSLQYIAYKKVPDGLGGMKKEGIWGYRYQATADEYLLSLKPIGFVPLFLNYTAGAIIRSLAERLAPGAFDLTDVDDGPVIAQYAVEPDGKFANVVKDLMDAASYVFWSRDMALHFKSQDDVAAHGQVTLDGDDPHFTPSRLTIQPSELPVINDITVLGDLEPQTYMNEFFVGTGLEGSFPLLADVYGVSQSVLLDEVFGGTSIDTNKWFVTDDPQDYLQVSNGYLNCIGGRGLGAYEIHLASQSRVPIDSRLRLTHGEWDFLPGTGNGVVCGLWSNRPTEVGFAGCLYGLHVLGSNSTLQPIVNGVLDATQYVNFDPSKRYVIRTLVETSFDSRYTQEYSYIAADGTRQAVGGYGSGAYVVYKTLVTEVDPATGAVTDQKWLSNETILVGIEDAFAYYVPMASDDLHATVSNITLSVPVGATLEATTTVPVGNASFEEWYDVNTPVGWPETISVLKETEWTNTGNSLKLEPNETGHAMCLQPIASKLEVGKRYNILVRLQKGASTSTGQVQLHLIGTDVDTTGLVVTAGELTAAFASYEGSLMDGMALETIPSDLKLKVELVGADGPMWVDDIIILGEWEQKLVGPNEVDAMDGLATVATIVQGNTGANTTDVRSGAAQYNPGQAQLVFFKDSNTRTSNVPPQNQLIRLAYRSAGPAVGRVRDLVSVASEAANWGDDGVRSKTELSLTPRPRTSLECELAAQAAVAVSSATRIQGTYAQYSGYFLTTDDEGAPVVFEPRAGMVFQFANLDSMVVGLQAAEVHEVNSSLESDGSSGEIFLHTITFGQPDVLRRALVRMEGTRKVFQNAPGTESVYVDPVDVGLNHTNDVTRPMLVGWDAGFVYVDAGQKLIGDESHFEVRYTDTGWGSDDGKNLIERTTSRSLKIPRNLRGKVFFIRTVDSVAGVSSRYSSGVRVAFPAPNVLANVDLSGLFVQPSV